MDFHYTKLLKNVIQISDCLGLCSTLVIGTKKALLFDTMSGFGNLKGYIRKFTDLPLIVVNSHGHFDHISGNHQFDSVYIPPLDIELIEEYSSRSLRKLLLKQFVNKVSTLNDYEEKAYLSQHFGRLEPIDEGEVINLGDITFTVMSLKGHTKGSIGLYSKELHLLLCGDGMTPIMCLFFPESMSLETYRDTLDYIITIPFQHFITGHHSKLFPKEIIYEFRNCIDKISSTKGMKFQYDLIPKYTGRLYIYEENNNIVEGMIGIILSQ